MESASGLGSPPGAVKDLRRTAWHEAGHAVAARALGFEVEYVTITPGDAGTGACKIRPPEWLAAKRLTEDHWAEIETVGAALLAHRDLCGDDLRALLG
jgi:hypothetical protein